MQRSSVKVRFLWLSIMVLVAGCLLVAGCARPPVITSITADPNPVPQNGISKLTAVASSPQGEAIFYYWHSDSGGSIKDTRLDTTTYSASKLSGVYPIRLRVMDSHQRTADDTFYIEVGGRDK